MSEEELKPVPSKGWAAMIWKVYEVDPMTCPKCGGVMKVIAFLTGFQTVDRIINHLNRSRSLKGTREPGQDGNAAKSVWCIPAWLQLQNNVERDALPGEAG